MSPRLFTEIRISHTCIEQKKAYELQLDKVLKIKGYNTRTEFIKEKIREIISNLNYEDLDKAYDQGFKDGAEEIKPETKIKIQERIDMLRSNNDGN